MFKNQIQLLRLVVLTQGNIYGQYISRNGKEGVSETIDSNGNIDSTHAITRLGKIESISNDGLTSGRASTSAYAIKQAFPSSID